MEYNACIHSKGKDEFKASYTSSGISSSLSKLPSTLSEPNAVATCFSLYSLPLMVTAVSHPSEVTLITILLLYSIYFIIDSKHTITDKVVYFIHKLRFLFLRGIDHYSFACTFHPSGFCIG